MAEPEPEPTEEMMIMEEREEMMVSSKGGDPTLRTAHFLKPSSVSSIDTPLVSDLLPSPPSLSSDSKKPPLKVTFNGWRQPSNKWKTWVGLMQSSHQPVWKKAGIHEAIMNSAYRITRNDKLVFELAEKWCPQTNTFVFPWGEATLTLEDVMVLGGFSVVGDSISTPLEATESKKIEQELVQARLQLCRSKAHKASQDGWLAKFMGCGSQIEHEAFLAYWLSRYVFPPTSSSSYNTLAINVFPIAVHLARGKKIALAPAVLASLYRDLSLLKQIIIASNILGTSACENVALSLVVWSPLQFVQIWAWARFVQLRPATTSSNVAYGGPRMARWDNAKKWNIENMRLAIYTDSAGGNFLWRPYANAVSNQFYNEQGKWLSVQQGMEDEEFESLALCLRVGELVGLGCIEQYLPHRVSRQFGLDQDIPGPVARSNATLENAWSNYKRPIKDKKLYIPPRHCEPGITTRYLEWWSKSKFGHQQEEAIKHVSEKKMRSIPQSCKTTDPAVPPGFPPKCICIESSDDCGVSKCIQMVESTIKPAEKIVESEHMTEGSAAVADDASQRRTHLMMTEDANESRLKPPVNNMVRISDNLGESSKKLTSNPQNYQITDPDAPPGFPPKCIYVESSESRDDDRKLISEMRNVKRRRGQPSIGPQLQSPSTLAGDSGAFQMMELAVKPAEKIVEREHMMEGSVAVADDACHQTQMMMTEDASESRERTPVNNMVSINSNNNRTPELSELPQLEIEARIGRLEKVVALLKAAKFGYRPS